MAKEDRQKSEKRLGLPRYCLACGAVQGFNLKEPPRPCWWCRDADQRYTELISELSWELALNTHSENRSFLQEGKISPA